MPACKLATDAARDVPGSTLVVDDGPQRHRVRHPGRPAPATSGSPARRSTPEGLYLGAYGPEDANPDIGDSAITETAGIGGFAMAAAPAIVKFVGGDVPMALRATRSMYEITLAEHPAYQSRSWGSGARRPASTSPGSCAPACCRRSTPAWPGRRRHRSGRRRAWSPRRRSASPPHWPPWPRRCRRPPDPSSTRCAGHPWGGRRACAATDLVSRGGDGTGGAGLLRPRRRAARAWPRCAPRGTRRPTAGRPASPR